MAVECELEVEEITSPVGARELSLRAHQLLDRMVTSRIGCPPPPLAREANGKPYYPTLPGLHFNLSHCPKAVACALADSPVGVDVERIPERLDEELVSRCFNRRERIRIRGAAEPTVEFARQWTRKEAYLKLIGTGIVGELDEVLTDEVLSDVRFETSENVRGGYVTTWCMKEAHGA